MFSTRFLLPFVLLSTVFILTPSCKVKKNKSAESEATSTEAPVDSTFINALMEAFKNAQIDTLEEESGGLNDRYNASATRVNDLLHTRLEVGFNIPAQQLNGKATLEFRPYFYPVDSLILDAKAFDIHRVALVGKGGAMTDLKYSYNDRQLRIALDRSYTRKETYSVYVQYTANPQRVKPEASAAITDARGLYFIDPKEEDPAKPTQIWTQGETESSSCWFPTIDKPNEKMTHELLITVPDKYVSLSNGLRTASKKNTDGTRTDIWKMDMPHAPYLVMMAIGEYAVVKDKWKNLDVDYYVEKEYEPHARKIFGNTPEMLSFFSEILGVEYPWQKYAQVVVRDYVSGAMENTSATIFGEFVQQTPEEMLDGNYEAIIAHELFHHWFGDLVTCESWANLPLNESFATYGEYLWEEHKYGRDAADYHLQDARNNYIEEAFNKKVPLIRFDYEFREDMFDRHSYQKGGCVLHMLRKYVGDEAFFESLKRYLNDNRFKPAEIHHLRLAFEEVTGEDLNWFFNQWFFGKGHPTVEASWSYADGYVSISLKQTQSLEGNNAFRLPMDVDIYNRGKATRVKIVMDSLNNTIRIAYPEQPDFVNIDAERMLLGFVKQLNTRKDAEWLLLNGKLYADRFLALERLLEEPSEPGTAELVKSALRDPFWYQRNYALNNLEYFMQSDDESFKPILLQLAQTDKDARVRASAIRWLNGNDEVGKATLKKALSDSSVQVQSNALSALYESDPQETAKILEGFEATAKGDMLTSMAAIYASSGTPGKYDFLEKAYSKISNPNDKYIFIQLIGRYALSQSQELVEKSTPSFVQKAKKESAWYLRLSAIQVIAEYKNYFDAKVDELEAEIVSMKEKGAAVADVQQKELQKTAVKKRVLDLDAEMDSIRETETDPNLTRILNMREP